VQPLQVEGGSVTLAPGAPQWRYVELKKTVFRLREDDPELRPWHTRLLEVSGEPDPLDTMLAEVEALQPDGTTRDPTQLELFGTLLTELQAMQKRPLPAGTHTVATLTGRTIRGTWDQDFHLQQSRVATKLPPGKNNGTWMYLREE